LCSVTDQLIHNADTDADDDDTDADDDVDEQAAAAVTSSVTALPLNVHIRQGSLPEFEVCSRLLYAYIHT